MNRSVEDTLSENGVDKIRYYFINSPLVNNAFTTCVFINSSQNRIECRGVSICSLMDTFSKTKGKNKAFGRAMKALVRKRNDDKINGSSRDDEFIKRSFKVKTQENEDYFRQAIAEELIKIDPELKISTESNDGGGKKYSFSVPLSYPIRLANSLFKYKSQFRPPPVTEEERNILRILEAKEEL